MLKHLTPAFSILLLILPSFIHLHSKVKKIFKLIIYLTLI